MQITYPRMLVDNGLQHNILCHQVPQEEFNLSDEIVVDKHFSAIVIKNNVVIDTLMSNSSKAFKVKSVKNLKAGFFAKTAKLKIIFIRNNIEKMKVTQSPHAINVNGVKCWLGYEFIVTMKLTKPEKMWNFITSSKDINPNSIMTENFVYLYKTILEEILIKNFSNFLYTSIGTTYYEQNKYKAAKAVSDVMWEKYKLFGYDIQAGWTYQFTKLGKF